MPRLRLQGGGVVRPFFFVPLFCRGIFNLLRLLILLAPPHPLFVFFQADTE